MARETKQDRLVRGIFDQMSEHLHDLKSLEDSATSKELDVERWAQGFLKSCLGFSATNGYSIRAQESKGKMRPDLIVFAGEKPIFVVEVKRLGFDLNKSDFRSGKTQLSEYLTSLGNVRWGMLTNGAEWKLYDFSQRDYGGIEVACYDLKSDDGYDLSKKSVEEHCHDFLDFHESSYNGETWAELSKEALAFSPDSIAKAILSTDVVRNIAKSIRGEYDFKANVEVLTDKIYDLLEQGLNDAIIGWSDSNIEEYHKYIKSQKRASRRTKRTRKAAAEATVETSATEAAPAEVPAELPKNQGGHDAA